MTATKLVDGFLEALAQEDFTELEMAVAVLWFNAYHQLEVELSSVEIAHKLQNAGLTGRINVSRLAQKLGKSRDLVKGSCDKKFRIAARRKSDLDEKYSRFLKRKRVQVDDSVVPHSQITGTRGYLERLVHQINGTYEYGFYDACAVLCRRLIESLLIEAFERTGHRQEIEKDGSLLMLEAIVKKANSSQYIKMSRNSIKAMEKVKQVGDTAAHDRHHITTEQDIAEFRIGFRRLVSELLVLADIKTSKRP